MSQEVSTFEEWEQIDFRRRPEVLTGTAGPDREVSKPTSVDREIITRTTMEEEHEWEEWGKGVRGFVGSLTYLSVIADGHVGCVWVVIRNTESEFPFRVAMRTGIRRTYD